ncbi:hypothetical protein Vafri_20189 [Volvox africanus]|uniref:Uncharacterized protein n=1 Tax=Volvox africanus TaxID=51714 RepID=A0A8J4BQW7_9CHLO|nr:hypothetical protein Vafri_20189 [Volvox africanus]
MRVYLPTPLFPKHSAIYQPPKPARATLKTALAPTKRSTVSPGAVAAIAAEKGKDVHMREEEGAVSASIADRSAVSGTPTAPPAEVPWTPGVAGGEYPRRADSAFADAASTAPAGYPGEKGVEREGS